MTRASGTRRGRRGLSRRVRLLAIVAAVVMIGALVTSTGMAQAMVRGLIGGPVPPGNDDLATAQTVDPSAASIDGTTVGASVETDENDVAAGDSTVWYRFTPTVSGTVYLSPSTDSPPAVRVYTGTAFPLTPVAADSSSGAVAFDATAGTTYLVQVDASADPAVFDFSLLQQQASGPDNDDLAAAVSLNEAANDLGSATGGLATGTTRGATVQDGEPSGATATVWYSWTVPDDGVTLDLAVDGGHTLGVFSGTDVGALTTVTADGTGGVTLSGTSGQVLLLRVGAASDDTDGAAGDFTLTGTLSGAPDADTTAPTVHCTPPTDWTSTVEVPCTATDSGSDLAEAADASFDLIADVPAGASGDSVTTGTKEVCDKAGNCVTAGPFTGLKIDRSPPAVDCAATSPNWVGAQAVSDCTATDAGSGLADPADASFALTTSVPAGTASADAAFSGHPDVCDKAGNCTAVAPPDPAHVDLAPPVVHCDAAPAGWQPGDATVTCTAEDADSGLADPSQQTVGLSTSIGDAAAGTDLKTGTAQVCDRVGNCVTAGPVGGLDVDRAAPVVTCTPPTGWHAGTTADIPCTAVDSDSGLADSADAAFVLTASIAAGQQSRSATSGSRQVCDAVGNCVTAGPFTVQLDDRPPTVTCQHTPSGWQDDDLQVGCTADDGDGSGVDAAGSAFALTADIANGTSSDTVAIAGRQVCDAVGNCATTPSLDLGKIDRITPKVVCDAPGGAHHAEVTVTCTSSDEGSGLADPALASFTLRTSVGDGNDDGAAETDTRTVCDLAGNCTVAGPVGPFDVDRSSAAPGGPPALNMPNVIHVLSARPQTAAGVNAGGAGAVPVPFDVPTATAAPGLSVRVGCNPEPGGLFPLGSTLVVCAATDDADRTTTKTVTMQVQLASDLAPPTAFRIGGLAQARGRGFAADTVVRIELDGALLAAVRSAGNGMVGVAVTIPAGTPPGAHTLVLRGIAPDGTPQLVVAPITLTTDQQTLVNAQPTGGTARDVTTGNPAPPPVTETLQGPATTTVHSTGTAESTSSAAPPPTLPVSTSPISTPATGTGAGRPDAGTTTIITGETAAPPATGTAAPTAAPTSATGSTPQQTFGGGPQQTTASSTPQAAAGTPQPSTPASTVQAAHAGGAAGVPTWLWWLLGALALCLVAAGVWLILFRRR